MSAAASTEIISFRAPTALKEKLDRIIEKTKQSRTNLLVYLLEEALTLEEWQLREVELGIQEANAGKFASQDRVDQVMKKWL